MSNTPGFSSPFADWSETLTCLFAAGVVLLGAFMWFGLTGQQDRAVYLGHGPALSEGVVLRTDRPARYIMRSDAGLAELRPGCRYDFNYANGHRGERKSRYVRSATLVDCFVSGALAMRFDPWVARHPDQTHMRALAAFCVLLLSVTASLAAEIRVGAAMHVKPMSIWFEEDAEGKLAEWQANRKGSAKAFAAYQKKLTAAREAWQFGGPHEVEILKSEPAQKRVQVKMKTEGRLQDSIWWVDPSAVVR